MNMKDKEFESFQRGYAEAIDVWQIFHQAGLPPAEAERVTEQAWREGLSPSVTAFRLNLDASYVHSLRPQSVASQPISARHETQPISSGPAPPAASPQSSDIFSPDFGEKLFAKRARKMSGEVSHAS